MKLHLSATGERYAFTGYGEGYVLVNNQRFEASLVLLPGRIIADWEVRTTADLAANEIEFLGGLDVDIVLLGTGPTQQFPDPALLKPLAQKGIGVEVMDTSAACRTFNILMAEDRRVAAAVML